MNFIVTNRGGLNVRAQMDTQNSKNILRHMSQGEGFTAQQTFNIKGMTGLQTWARISNNAGSVNQEFACLQIGNIVYAKEESQDPLTQAPVPLSLWIWIVEVDTWLRDEYGYKGPKPG